MRYSRSELIEQLGITKRAITKYLSNVDGVETGRILPNGSKYKAMLNKSISDVGWSSHIKK